MSSAQTPAAAGSDERAARRPVLLASNLGDAERQVWRQALAHALPEAEWLDLSNADEAAAARHRASEIDVAVVANPPPGQLQGWPALRLVQSLWAGVDRLLADPTLPPSVPVARMVDPAMSAAMAETALWAVLSLHRGFFHYAAQQRAGQWRQRPQRRADEVAVLVLGQGAMGQACSARLREQGYAVRGWRRDGQPLVPLLGEAEVVLNLLPLTPDTHGLVDAAFLSALPRGAALVNLARGAHVVETDLRAALDAGQLAHAVLDVFATEPLPREHWCWQHPRVTVLPHAAALTDPRSASAVVAANLRALWAGQALQHRVDRARGY